MPGATIVDFYCAICGKLVAYQELYPAGVPRAAERGGDHPLRNLDRYWHYASDGDRMGDRELTVAEFEREVATLAGDHPESFIALYCRDCRLVYCFDHWQVTYSGDPEMSFGRCPRGHPRVIDAG